MNAKSRTWLGSASIGLLLGGATLFTAGFAAERPVASAPYQYDADDYVYYPDLNVYYYPSTGTYAWYDHGGHFRSSQHLPPAYTVSHARKERLRLYTHEPYEEPTSAFSPAVPVPYRYPTPDDFAAHGD
jgi:hypothetical protein